METQCRYSRAPITEAIIDLRVKLPEGTTFAQLERCVANEAGAYPIKGKFRETTARMEVGEGLSTSASTKHVGFALTSADRKQLFQVRLDGFAMIRLAPYDSWAPFRDETRRLWDNYRKSAHPVKVERMAVRYVNRLDLPLPLADFKEYLRTLPEVSRDLSQTLAGFFMQLIIPQEDIRSTLVLNQAMIPPPRPEVVSVVLDLDLFRDADLPTEEEEVWRLFEDLHTRKNQVFEACITDSMRELIK
jgi:uncharacterized protein (TIGR04255 family)